MTPVAHPSRRGRSQVYAGCVNLPAWPLLIRNLGLSGGDWLNVHGEAHVFEAPDQALGLCDLGAAVEMIGTEILIYSSVFEHVVHCRENGGGDGADRLLWPAAALQAQILGLQIAPLFVLGRPAALDERGLEPLRAFAQTARSAFPGTLVVARTQAGPGQQMSHSGEAAHVEADLGDDHFRAERAYAGDGPDEVDGGAKGGEAVLHLPVNRPDGCIETIDLAEMELQQKTMMGRQPPAQSLPQLGLRAFHVWIRKSSKPDRIGLAGHQRVEDRSSTLAEHVGEFCIQFDVGILQRLVNALDLTGCFADLLLAGAQQGAQFLRLAIRDKA